MNLGANFQGFYLLRRGWMVNEVFITSAFCRRAAWVWLIEHASYVDNEFLRRGELLASYDSLATEWGWSKDKVARFMRALRTQGMIRIKTRGKRPSLITVCNYSNMQTPPKAQAVSDEAHFEQLETLHRHATATPCNELKNNKDTTQLSLKEMQHAEQLFVILHGVIQNPRDYPALHDMTELERWKRTYDWDKFVVPTLTDWTVKNRQKTNPTLITSYRYLTKILESKARPKRTRKYLFR